MRTKRNRAGNVPEEENLPLPSVAPAQTVANDPNLNVKVSTPLVGGWVPSIPVVVGTPSPSFEPRAQKSAYLARPYRPDSVVDGWATDQFVVRAVSQRGLSHRYTGAPRQDDLALGHPEGSEFLLIAVADGVSSATQSHIGATIAVRNAIQLMHDAIDGPDEAIDWTLLFRQIAWQLVEQSALMFNIPEGEMRPQQAEQLIATTLVCACVKFSSGAPGARLKAAAVGDSGVWVLGADGFEHVLGGKPVGDSPISSSAVAGLPRIPAELSSIDIQLDGGTVLLIGTDGFGDPLGSGDGSVGLTFRTALMSPPTMLDFARLIDFSRETFDDDRSLVATWIRPIMQESTNIAGELDGPSRLGP